jgi:hypothetical protein
MKYLPQTENIVYDNKQKVVYYYCDKTGKPIFKAKEIYKNKAKIVVYPYYVDLGTDEIFQRKIRTLEFEGWSTLGNLPDAFKKIRQTYETYGLIATQLKQIVAAIYRKYEKVSKIVFGINLKNSFSEKSVTLNWGGVENMLADLNKESKYHLKNKKLYINNELSNISSRFKHQKREIFHNELSTFLLKFDSFERITERDSDSLSRILDVLPKSVISVTSNFIKTKEKINIAYLESILEKFENLLKIDTGSEKRWQSFFENNSWIFSHLFPYEVILKEKEAYVGGKTIKNADGKVVDFLLANGFQDNYALIEIKTHKKDLLKKTPYRGEDVFSMSEELSGGINQCLDQKDNFLKHFGRELRPLDPKVILIIGQKSQLSPEQSKCFELLRSNQKNVDIITFDELLTKLNGLLKVIKIS